MFDCLKAGYISQHRTEKLWTFWTRLSQRANPLSSHTAQRRSGHPATWERAVPQVPKRKAAGRAFDSAILQSSTHLGGAQILEKEKLIPKNNTVHILSPRTLFSHFLKMFTAYPLLRQTGQDLATPPSGFHFSLLNSLWRYDQSGFTGVSIPQRLCVCVCLYSYVLRQLILFIQINSFNTNNTPMKLELLVPFYIWGHGHIISCK